MGQRTQAIVLSVGDELTLGQTVDTNSAWLSRQLAAAGCAVAAHVTVPDDEGAIEKAIGEAVWRCDFLVVSGGLGPTEDDLTRQALAAVLGEPLEADASWLKELEKFFALRGRPMPEANRLQAMVPRGARMVWNTCGTAAGIDAAYQTPDLKHSCRVFVMPGVPKEMKAMFARDVLPHVKAAGGGAVILSRTLHTYGLGESAIGEKLGEIMRRGRNPSVGTTVSEGQVSLRINASFGSAAEAERELEQTEKACRAALGDLVFGSDGQTLEEVVTEMLKERDETVSAAESCTGGLMAKLLSDTPGSKLQLGFVTYETATKTSELGIPAEFIEEHGVVSEAVVLEMARRARERGRSTYALASTGFAGPDGGEPGKPVGTVCLAIAHKTGTSARTFNFPGDREMVVDRAAKMALTMLRFRLLGRKVPF